MNRFPLGLLATGAILASRLAKLNTCRGASCRVNVGTLPEPG